MSTTFMRTLAETLYQTRKGMGLSQEKMAEKCYISSREYSDIEKAKRQPLAKTFIDFIIACELDANIVIKNIIEGGYIPNDDRNSA